MEGGKQQGPRSRSQSEFERHATCRGGLCSQLPLVITVSHYNEPAKVQTSAVDTAILVMFTQNLGFLAFARA